ncbi:hypothetical protein [Hymenobacter canadensis]|uniref:Uncharacterized protein n=1 Tax=Hymenobacter canadensis TaxID=2999067 RepID=A0ABY7LLY5_9BACT|nr:hypothetical protein [Hymenobacter canadensis]WBA40462.1 hypothetical protein O3303_11540 [Hymenobacter canadensis]
MQADTRRFFGAALLLGAVFCAVYLRVAYPPPPELEPERRWGAPRLLVSDRVLYGFVRELLAQADSTPPSPYVKKKADYWVSRVLFEHALLPISYAHVDAADIRYPYGQESAWMMRQLHAERILSAADTVFMQRQIHYSTGFQLEPRFLPSCRIIPVDTLTRLARQHAIPEAGAGTALAYLKNKYQTDFISSLSAPLFSLDGRYALTTITLSIGIFCGVGNTTALVMEKKNGRWGILRAVSR